MKPLHTALLLVVLASSSCSDMATKPIIPVRVTGIILDRDGAPLPGTRLEFAHRYSPGDPYSYYFYTASTNASGTYSVDLIPGGYWVYVAPPDQSGYSPTGLVADFSGRAGILDYRFTGFKISGTVATPGGGVLSQGSVYAQGSGGSGGADIRGGAFTLILPAGTYDFRLDAYTAVGIPGVTVHNVVVAADTALSFTLDGNLIRGTVRGPGGIPLGAARVRADAPDARATAITLVDGTYAMYLPSMDYLVTVTPGPQNSYIASLGPSSQSITGPQTIDFDLAGVEWTGIVRLAPSGNPLPGASVYASGGGVAYGYAYSITDGLGRFRLVLRPYGIYDLQIQSQFPAAMGRIEGLQAVNDSTLDITVDPLAP